MALPSKLYAVVADLTGSVEYSSNNPRSCEDMYYRIPSSFRSAFSLWEFIPCGSYDQIHLNQTHKQRRKKNDNQR